MIGSIGQVGRVGLGKKVPRGAAAAGPSMATVSQGGLSFDVAGAVTTGNYVDGPIWIYAPSGNVTLLDDPVHPVQTDGGGLVVHGAQMNPLFDADQSYDARASNFDPAGVMSFPATLGVGDVVIKSRSHDPGNTGVDLRKGILEEVASIFVVDSVPGPDAFSPVAVDWAGRGAKTPFNIDMDAVMADFVSVLPQGGFDTSAFGPDVPSYSDIITGLDSMPLLGQQHAPGTDGGQEVIGNTRNSFSLIGNNNYGQNLGVQIGSAYLLAISDTVTDAERRELVMRLIRLGLQWYYAFEGAAKPWGANGGRHQFWFQPVVLAARYAGLGTTAADIMANFPGNATQYFEITQSMIDNDFVKHELDTKPYTWRRRQILATTATTVTFSRNMGGDPSQAKIENLEMRNWADDSLIKLIDNDDVISSDNGQYVVDIGVHTLLVTDHIYFTPPFALTAGMFDWYVGEGNVIFPENFNHYNPSPQANYRSINHAADEAICALLHGDNDPAYAAIIGYTERAWGTDDPAGYDIPQPWYGAFTGSFMTAHWDTMNGNGPVIGASPSIAQTVYNREPYNAPASIATDITVTNASNIIVLEASWESGGTSFDASVAAGGANIPTAGGVAMTPAIVNRLSRRHAGIFVIHPNATGVVTVNFAPANGIRGVTIALSEVSGADVANIVGQTTSASTGSGDLDVSVTPDSTDSLLFAVSTWADELTGPSVDIGTARTTGFFASGAAGQDIATGWAHSIASDTPTISYLQGGTNGSGVGVLAEIRPA